MSLAIRRPFRSAQNESNLSRNCKRLFNSKESLAVNRERFFSSVRTLGKRVNAKESAILRIAVMLRLRWSQRHRLPPQGGPEIRLMVRPGVSTTGPSHVGNRPQPSVFKGFMPRVYFFYRMGRFVGHVTRHGGQCREVRPQWPWLANLENQRGSGRV